MLAETSGLVKNPSPTATADEIKSAGLPEKWKSFGTGFINTGRWIETIYNGATKK
jgi:hypothetical protein